MIPEILGASQSQASMAASHAGTSRPHPTLLPNLSPYRPASQSGPVLLPPVRTISKYDYGREKLDKTVHQRGVNPVVSEESWPAKSSSRSDVLIDLNNSVEQAETGSCETSSVQAPIDLSAKVVEDLIDLTD